MTGILTLSLTYKLLENTNFPFSVVLISARYFIMKCNNQRNLDISMAKVTGVMFNLNPQKSG